MDLSCPTIVRNSKNVSGSLYLHVSLSTSLNRVMDTPGSPHTARITPKITGKVKLIAPIPCETNDFTLLPEQISYLPAKLQKIALSYLKRH